MRPTLSSSSHVDERDRNPDAISPPRALSPAPCALTPAARSHSRLTRAEKSKHSNIYTEMNWETTEKTIANQGTTVQQKDLAAFLFLWKRKEHSFRVKYARVCAFHWTLWYFPQEVFKTSFGPDSVWSWTLFYVSSHPAWCASACEELSTEDYKTWIYSLF